jgi:hypothetical protein
MTEIWSLTSTGPVYGEVRGAQIFYNVHDPAQCAGRHCVLHNPSDHHMRDWPTLFRTDKHQMERTCPHGIGHPDPDDLAWHVSEGRDYLGVHGCDGCCGNTTR